MRGRPGLRARRGDVALLLLPSGVANGLVGFGSFEGGADLFCERGIRGSDFGKEVEGFGGLFEFSEIGLGVGEGEEVVAVPVFGELAKPGGEGEGFLRAADLLVLMGGEDAREEVGGIEEFGGGAEDFFAIGDSLFRLALLKL